MEADKRKLSLGADAPNRRSGAGLGGGSSMGGGAGAGAGIDSDNQAGEFEDHDNNSSHGGHEVSTSAAASDKASSSFDRLELLGPSLLEALTLKKPPRLKSSSHQDNNNGDELATDALLASSPTGGGDPNGMRLDNNDGGISDQRSSKQQFEEAERFEIGVTCSAILGKLVDPSVDNSRKVQELFTKMIEKLQCDATGLVLLQESTVMIFLESSEQQFVQICEYLQRNGQVFDVSSLRILGSCDDNPTRYLHGLYFKKIVINRSNDGNSDWTDEFLRQHVVNCFLNITKFVKKLGPMQPAEIRKQLTNLSNTDQAILPANDFILWLIGREELMTLDEFLELYGTPIMIELESERVWPVHPLISY